MPALPQSFLTLPIAHRGLHDLPRGIPENSLAAAAAAIAAGYAIELDVQPSKDGVAMVFHDDDMPRLTGRDGLITDYTAAALGEIDLAGGNEPVPTLAEFLSFVAGRVPLLIEIKSQDAFDGTNSTALVAEVARVLDGYQGDVALMSFNPHAVLALRDAIPHLARGLTTWGWDDLPESALPAGIIAPMLAIDAYDAAGCSFISHDHTDLSRPRVAELKAQGAKILCWTIRSPAEEQAARVIADNITFENYRA